MVKAYVCNRFPTLSIRHIKFENGLYETSSPEEQAMIEGSDWYGVHIHPRDHDDEATLPPEEPLIEEEEAKQAPRKGSGARQGTTGTKALGQILEGG